MQLVSQKSFDYSPYSPSCTFFLEHSAWIEENNIKNYLEYKEQLIKSSKTAAFKEAVQKIEEYISDPVVSKFFTYIVFSSVKIF